MPYYKLLQKIVANSGYTQKYISEKCTEMKIPLDRSYLTKLLGNKSSAPSENISRAIAKICNVDERLLVIEGYFDKAPKEIRDFFVSFKEIIAYISPNLFSNEFDTITINQLKQEIENEPLADFIIWLMDNIDISTNITKNGVDIISNIDNNIFQLPKPYFLKCEDNGMFPLIKENDEIIPEIKSKYYDGDIVLVNIKKENKTVIRQIMFLDNQSIKLIAINKEFLSKPYKKEDISIIGKISKIIQTI